MAAPGIRIRGPPALTRVFSRVFFPPTPFPVRVTSLARSLARGEGRPLLSFWMDGCLSPSPPSSLLLPPEAMQSALGKKERKKEKKLALGGWRREADWWGPDADGSTCWWERSDVDSLGSDWLPGRDGTQLTVL